GRTRITSAAIVRSSFRARTVSRNEDATNPQKSSPWVLLLRNENKHSTQEPFWRRIEKATMAATREDVIEYLKSMTLLEASQLVKELEETFGVSAAAAVATPAAGASAGGEV